MAKVMIKVDDKEYPCRPTMGAVLLFKQETGHDLSAMTGEFEVVAKFLWCCLRHTCKLEGVPFDYDFEKFCDGLDLFELQKWTKSIEYKEPAGGQKKI